MNGITDITIFLNTGCQRKFIPAPTEEWREAAELAAQRGMRWQPSPLPYLKWRLGGRAAGGVRECGLWLAIETNRPDPNMPSPGILYDKKTVERDSEIQDRLRENPNITPPDIYINVPAGGRSPVLAFGVAVGGGAGEDEGKQVFMPFCHLEKEAPETEGPEGAEGGIRVRIGVRRPNTAEPSDVTIAIDFGNTRSVALFVAEPSGQIQGDGFKSACRPVMLRPAEDAEVDDDARRNVENAIVNSWLFLEEPEFLTAPNRNDRRPEILEERWNRAERSTGWGIFRKTRTFIESVEYRIPFVFARYSPVSFGDGATAHLRSGEVQNLLNQGALIQQSSPKRYYWATDRMDGGEVFWNMIPGPGAGEADLSLELPTLSADVLRFFKEDGTYFAADENEDATFSQDAAPPRPQYPRGNTFIWMLLGILERAWIQCNANPEGVAAFRDFRLTDIVITHPAGWTRHEIADYRRACATAIEIFSKTQFPGKGRRITLNMNLNEAVASQLPFLFSEISGYRNLAGDWIAMAGKMRGGHRTVRVMNFDIGGGTADVSIIEYENAPGSMATMADIIPRQLFKDGFSIAGDDILREILQRCVIPGISRCAVTKRGVRPEETRAMMLRHLTGMFQGMRTPNENIKRVNWLKLCLIPLGIEIMRKEAAGAGDGRVPILGTQGILGQDDWDKFVWAVNANPANISLPDSGGGEIVMEYDPADVREIAREIFETHFIQCGKNAERFDVDIFFLSGKTSELPAIAGLARRHIPLPLNRIVSAKDYRTGDWYPFVSADGTVTDAKSVTAVGAALYHMIQKGKIANWSMQDISLPESACSFIWGFYDELRINDKPFDFTDGRTEARLPANGALLGRKITAESVAEPIYLFRKRKGAELPGNVTQVDAVLEKTPEKIDDVQEEFLRIASVSAGGWDCTELFELAVWRISDLEAFWQDSGEIFKAQGGDA